MCSVIAEERHGGAEEGAGVARDREGAAAVIEVGHGTRDGEEQEAGEQLGDQDETHLGAGGGRGGGRRIV